MIMIHSATDDAPELTGKRVLFILIGFFGVVFAVNAYFMFAAISTHTGVVSNEPYRKGLTYNRRIAEDERQSNLAWRAVLDPVGKGTLRLGLTDAAGAPVRNLSVNAVLSRPATADGETQVTFTETTPGSYEVDIAGLERGAWVVSVAASRPRETEIAFRLRKRLWLAP
jgi:nitrogen fixation protein FixH